MKQTTLVNDDRILNRALFSLLLVTTFICPQMREYSNTQNDIKTNCSQYPYFDLFTEDSQYQRDTRLYIELIRDANDNIQGGR